MKMATELKRQSDTQNEIKSHGGKVDQGRTHKEGGPEKPVVLEEPPVLRNIPQEGEGAAKGDAEQPQDVQCQSCDDGREE